MCHGDELIVPLGLLPRYVPKSEQCAENIKAFRCIVSLEFGVTLAKASLSLESQRQGGVEGGKSPQQRYIVETITMTTVTERRIVREADEHVPRRDISSGNNSKIITSECDNNRLSGILKGGKLWKSSDVNTPGPDSMFKSTPPMIEETSTSFSSSTPLKDSENTDLTGRRSVRFSETASGNQDINDSCQDSDTNQSVKYDPGYDHNTPDTTAPAGEEASSPDSTELTLTFKLGNHVLVANSLRPNSAVRQLFPAQRFLSPPPLTHGSSYEDSGGEEDALNQSKARVIEDLQEVQSQWTDKINSDPSQQYIVTAESLRMFEEAKRSKFAQFKNNKDNANFQDNQSYTAVIPTLPLVSSTTNGNSDNDESPKNQIRRTIERNALRRSLLRYSNEPGSNRKHAAAVRKNSEDSLVERIRKLTCDLDEEEDAKKQKSNGKEPSKPGIDVATETAGDDLEIDFGINSTIPPRSSPPGEESRKPRETQSNKFITSPSSDYGVRFIEKTSSPSASTSSSNSSGSTSSTYKKLTDLFARRNNENKTTDSNNSTQRNDCEINHLSYPPPASESQNWDTNSYQQTEYSQFNPPDLGNGSPNNVTPPKDFAENMLTSSAPDIHEKNIISGNFVGPKCAVLKVSSTAEARKQFLSTLAPLTACVSAVHSEDSDGLNDDHYKQVPVTSPLSVSVPGDRTSVASTNTAGEETEYSLDDIDEVLQDDQKAPQPDVVAGTQPQGSNTQVCDDTNGPIDELALFVQQDAGRTERIKKRYSLNSSSTASEDDEHDDYGFNRRPSVRGIKPRFCSTSEILQQIQAQHQPPALVTRVGSHMTWPYNSPETDDPALAHAPIGRRRGILHMKNTGTMPVLQEENPYTYSPTEQNRMNIGIPYSGDYHPGAVVHQPSPTDSVRKDGVTRRYVTPNQIMYASTGNLYQHPQQIMRIGGGCSDLQMYGSLGNRPHHHVQHLQYPAASNSPPPPGVYCNYPQQFQQGSQEQILPLPVTDPGNAPGFHQHYLEDQRFSSVQSLDRNTSSMYGRRGNQGLVQMRVSPVSAGFTPHYTGQVGPAAANIRFATPFNDPNVTAIIEPHYSTLQYAKPCPNNSSNATSIIRVGQGQQQTIRVPYPSGTPVKVHLLTRTGVGCPRSESPQRGPGSPVGHQSSSTLPSGQYASPPQQYAIARGTQTSSTPTTSSTFYQVPPNARYYPQTPPMTNNIGPMYNHIPPQQMHNNTRVSMVNAEHAVRPIHSPPPMNYCKPHVQQQTGRTTSPLPYQNISSSSSSTASSSPTRNKYSNERGVPEGAASSSPSFPQDSLYHLPLSTSNALSPVDSNTQTLAQSPISAPNTSVTSGTTSVYYAMNV
uniref:Uncharacterized protein n=1 Tax=Timema cristinae TaxID=61476 RepID=A0A7R9GR07_TIMCR|nr:unnamed protein product [Timema cristinae]